MGFIPKANELAAMLHEEYRLRIKGWPTKSSLDVSFSDLPVDLQDANLGQALRIPRILRFGRDAT